MHKGPQDSSQKQRQDHKRAEMAERRGSTTTHTEAIPNKAKTDKQAVLWRSSDKKQLTCVQNKETGRLLNDPDAVLEYIQRSFQEQAKPASGSAKTGVVQAE